MTRVIFEKLIGASFIKVRLKLLNGLELDGYCESLELAFEFNGIQHYRYDPHFHRREGDLERQMERDKTKRLLCADNIALIVIPYWEATDGPTKLAKFIVGELTALGYDEYIINDYNYGGFDAEIIKEAYSNAPGNAEKLNRLREAVVAKGYKLLDDIYVDLRNHRYKIQCVAGHIYESNGDNILDKRGRYCPHEKCNGKPVVDDESIADFAAKRYFEYCDDYSGKNSASLLNFRCIMGHDIHMSWDNFKQYKNCKECFGQVPRTRSYKAISAIAERHGGSVKSMAYKKLTEEMEFIAADGVAFYMAPEDILRGKWN
jgi:hypothetical protein